jgi:hypothetical protein
LRALLVGFVLAGCHAVLPLHPGPPSSDSTNDSSQIDATSDAKTADLRTDSRIGDRVPGPIVLYLFDENQGTVVHDRGAGFPYDLQVHDRIAVAWAPGALTIKSPTVLENGAPDTKVLAACGKSNAVTVEAWIKPAKALQGGPGRIVSLAESIFHQNLVLGHGRAENEAVADRFAVRLATTTGKKILETPTASATAQLTHLVYTREASGAARIYINRTSLPQADHSGELKPPLGWLSTCKLSLADLSPDTRPWLGTYHLVAIYGRALTVDEVAQNHAAGADPEL